MATTLLEQHVRRVDDDEDDDDRRRRPKKKNGGGLLGILLAVVGVLLLCFCCLPVGIVGGYLLYPKQHPLVGQWESVNRIKVQFEQGGKRTEEVIVEARLEINGADDKGAGVYFDSASGDEIPFTWSKHDAEKKTVDFTFDARVAKDRNLWNGLNSPTTFVYKTDGKRLTLKARGPQGVDVHFDRVDTFTPAPLGVPKGKVADKK